MSAREKKLLLIFGLAGFVILNFFGYSFLKNTSARVNQQREQARKNLDSAERFRESSAEVMEEMVWLDEHEPEPAEKQNVQTTLQQFAEREAKAAGLTVKNQKPMPTDETGANYHRAKIQIVVTGTEEALYGWFDHLNAPDQLRMATHIRLSPNTDDTLIDCTTTVEQWFVPPQT